MAVWRVHKVMTVDVISAPDDASIAEIAAILAEHRITAVPIVNAFDLVVGILSWTDLHHMIDPADKAGGGLLSRDRATEFRWPEKAAIEVMSAPPFTVRPDASLAAAGRLMHTHNIGRLLVTDRPGRLIGIVTRRDLLKVHARLDAVIRQEVTHRILRQTMMIEPRSVQVAVDDGVVMLTGHLGRKSTALVAVGLTEAVAGVTRVIDRLSFDTDDIVGAPAPAPPDDDPVDDWWTGRRPDDEETGDAAAR